MAFHTTRENESGLDLNREIDGDKVELVAGVKIFLRDRRFDFSIYFHEDWEVSEFYFCEAKRDEKWFGPAIIDQVRDVTPIDTEVGESDEVISAGVFQVDPKLGTSAGRPVAERAQAHIAYRSVYRACATGLGPIA